MMEQFRNTSVILMSLLMWFCFTDGAITSFDLDASGSPTSGATASFSKSIAETSDDTAVLLTVTATTDASAITAYSIATQPNAGQFEVTSAGTVSLATGKILDYETETSISIEVKAVDDTGTPESGTATIAITVTNVNANTPTFTILTSVSLTLDDQTAANTLVYTVLATDADSAPDNTVTYAFGSGNTNSDFAIGTSDGKVTVANALNMATTSTYTLVVHAKDSDGVPNTGSATISVLVCKDLVCSASENGAETGTISIITLMTATIVSLCKLM